MISRVLGLGVIGGVIIYAVYWFTRQQELLEKTVIKLRGLKVVKFGLKETKLKVTLGIRNNTEVNFAIKNQIYNVYINDRFVTKATINERIVLNPNTETFANVDVVFSPIQVLGIAFVSLANLSQSKLIVKGQVTFISNLIVMNNIPINIEENMSELLNKN